MSPTTRDVCPMPGTNLSTPAATVPHRSKTNNPLPSNTPSELCPTPNSTCGLPHDVVEIIIAHLSRNLGDLKACSLTCRSWYIAAVQHLHHTLTLTNKRLEVTRRGLKPLSKLHELGLTPLIKEIRVEQFWSADAWFVPRAFSQHDLRYFSALTNVHTLRLRKLGICHFISTIDHHFGHFSQTLRSITLFDPTCTPRQLSHFLSLFSNLEDIEINGGDAPVPDTTIPDTALTPFSVPKLRGRLVLYEFHWAETWTDLTTLCGGLRFHHMDLRGRVSCAAVLFEACSETLETLRFEMVDWTVGDQYTWFPGFNISRLKVLRSLQVAAWAGFSRIDHYNTTVMEMVSTITSPAFSEFIIVLDRNPMTYLPQELPLFKTLGKMYKIKPFKLVFSLKVSHLSQAGARREFAGVLGLVTGNDHFDSFDSPPIVRCM